MGQLGGKVIDLYQKFAVTWVDATGIAEQRVNAVTQSNLMQETVVGYWPEAAIGFWFE
jgi:hypothetical protein